MSRTWTKKSSAQSSFTAIIGTVFCVGLFAVALSYAGLSASLIGERFTQSRVQSLALLLSNDLLFNPGTESHQGLALYDPTTHSVQEHELDPQKILSLANLLKADPHVLNKQWSVGNPIALKIWEQDGTIHLDLKNKGGSAFAVTRLAMMDGRHVLIRLTLFD